MMNQFYQTLCKSGVSRFGRLAGVKNYFFALAVMLMTSLSMTVMAQDLTVSGTVKGTDGVGVPGVTVQAKGTAKGTQTDIDGNFKLAGVPKNATLVLSSVGMQSQEIVVGNKTVFDVIMKDDSKTLEEVVVVGYGTQKRKEISGTVTSLSSRDFNSGVVTNPLQAAQGKVAGLVITQSSGDPNAKPTVRLRGTGSLTAGSEPLYVIDGVIGAPIENVAPEDILSMDILRDASSAAIYGSRGANGVIIINTKRGKSGAVAVDYSGYVGMETISQKPDLMNGADFRAAAAKYSQTFTDNGANTDWLKTITRTATSQNHNLGVSGGTENFSYRASIGYLNQVGTLLGSGKDRINARFNADSKALNGKLSLKYNISASQTNSDIAQNIALGLAQNMRPTDPIYNADGTYFQIPGTFSNYNPLAVVNGRKQNEKLNDLLGNVQAAYTLMDGLVFAVGGTIRTQTKNGSFFQDSNTGVPFNNYNGNFGARYLDNVLDKQFESTLNYSKKFGSSTFGALVGYTFQDVQKDGFSAANYNFLTDNLGANNLGGGLGTITNPSLMGSYKNEYKLASFLGRIQYGYMDKYFATVNLRQDGSTKFGTNNKWGFFPSVSVGWALSKEDFLKSVTAIDNLKLRVSWGRTGNSEGINPNLSSSFYGPGSGYPTSSGAFYPSYGFTSNANPDLKWEVNENYGAGLDFSLWKSRLTGSIDYYVRKTKDLLYNVPVDQAQNFYPTTLKNVGTMQNKGVEITLDYQWIDTKKFSWHSIFTGSFNKNVLLTLPGSENGIPLQISLGNFIRGTSAVAFSQLKAGQPVGVFYGAVVDHISDKGAYVFKDLNGDGKVEPSGADRAYLGDPNPYFVGSLTNSFTYGNFDASFQLTSNMGNKIMNTTSLLLGRQDGRIAESNALRSALTSPINDATTIPMSYYVESGNFVRLNNATIGYTIPNLKGILHRARVYVAGNNLLLFTKYSGVDPEVSQGLNLNPTGGFVGLNGNPLQAPGVDVRETYYKTRAFTAGVSLTF